MVKANHITQPNAWHPATANPRFNQLWKRYKTLNAAINGALASSEVQTTFTTLGWDAKIASPQEFAGFLAAEVKKWPPLVKAAGLEPD